MKKKLVTILTTTLLLAVSATGCSAEMKSEDMISWEEESIAVEDSESDETDEPGEEESAQPATEEPAPMTTEELTPEPTEAPTQEPTEEPTPEPTKKPTPVPTQEPTLEPTKKPTPVPTQAPAPVPTEEPKHIHSWTNVSDSLPATCGSDGYVTYVCSCGDTNTERQPATGNHSYGYGAINCTFCGIPHTHDWKLVVQTNSGVEIIPDEDFCCHSGWYFDTFAELREHMEIPNVHGMVYLNDGSNGVTSVPRDYTGEVDFYACCHGWANCSGDGEGERIEYEITQEVQFCKLCGVRGEAFDLGPRVILSHTIDD